MKRNPENQAVISTASVAKAIFGLVYVVCAYLYLSTCDAEVVLPAHETNQR